MHIASFAFSFFFFYQTLFNISLLSTWTHWKHSIIPSVLLTGFIACDPAHPLASPHLVGTAPQVLDGLPDAHRHVFPFFYVAPHHFKICVSERCLGDSVKTPQMVMLLMFKCIFRNVSLWNLRLVIVHLCYMILFP